MKKIKEIIRLSVATDFSNRKIARACSISRPIVTKCLVLFKSSGLTYDEIKDLNDESVNDLFFPNPRSKLLNNERYAYLSSQFEYLLNEIKRPHVTLIKLWEEYIENKPDGYSRSQFCELFNRWRKSFELSMHLEHKAGDKMFVDFTGKKLYLTDRITGNKKPAETFVAILPASHYTFVCATETQKTKDWIKGTEEAKWYFGGSTTSITPDCYKSAVKKYNKYDPEINPEYSLFAEHYDTVILPARPLHPKDKALVENAVKIVYHWIYASLRNQTFYTLGELNRAILLELDKYNSKKMQISKLSRIELFEKIEKNALKPLPISLFDYKSSSKASIQSDYHIKLSVDKKYYSVPYKYYSESLKNSSKKIKADIYYTNAVVEIFFKGERIASHKRDYTGQKYITKAEHMPEKHKRYLERWNPERMINLAKSKGDNISELVERIIVNHKHPEQSYKTCRGLIFLSKSYGAARLDKACKKALYFGYHSYNAVNEMLKNNNEDYEEQPDLFSQILPEHENIRGKNYYKTKLLELI
jgi:transposase